MSNDNDTEITFEQVRAVKRAHSAALMRKANVVGVGVGLRQQDGAPTGEMALVVMVRQKLPTWQLSADDIIPTEIDDVPVDVQEVGDIRAQ